MESASGRFDPFSESLTAVEQLIFHEYDTLGSFSESESEHDTPLPIQSVKF
jgi:hypothetical protein